MSFIWVAFFKKCWGLQQFCFKNDTKPGKNGLGKGVTFVTELMCLNLCFECPTWNTMVGKKCEKVQELRASLEIHKSLMWNASKTSRGTRAETLSKVEDESDPHLCRSPMKAEMCLIIATGSPAVPPTTCKGVCESVILWMFSHQKSCLRGDTTKRA